MSEEFPVGTKVMVADWSPLMGIMGKYGVVAKYNKETEKYTLRSARASLESFIISKNDFNLSVRHADDGFPRNATATIVLQSLGVGGRRKNRRATKKGRKNRGHFSRRKKNL